MQYIAVTRHQVQPKQTLYIITTFPFTTITAYKLSTLLYIQFYSPHNTNITPHIAKCVNFNCLMLKSVITLLFSQTVYYDNTIDIYVHYTLSLLMTVIIINTYLAIIVVTHKLKTILIRIHNILHSFNLNRTINKRVISSTGGYYALTSHVLPHPRTGQFIIDYFTYLYICSWHYPNDINVNKQILAMAVLLMNFVCFVDTFMRSLFCSSILNILISNG